MAVWRSRKVFNSTIAREWATSSCRECSAWRVSSVRNTDQLASSAWCRARSVCVVVCASRVDRRCKTSALWVAAASCAECSSAERESTWCSRAVSSAACEASFWVVVCDSESYLSLRSAWSSWSVLKAERRERVSCSSFIWTQDCPEMCTVKLEGNSSVTHFFFLALLRNALFLLSFLLLTFGKPPSISIETLDFRFSLT